MRHAIFVTLALACGCDSAPSIDEDAAIEAGTDSGSPIDSGLRSDAGFQSDGGIAPIASPDEPLVARGADYMGSPERFNRYYTDIDWTPSQIIFVSPTGGGSGASRDAPT